MGVLLPTPCPIWSLWVVSGYQPDAHTARMDGVPSDRADDEAGGVERVPSQGSDGIGAADVHVFLIADVRGYTGFTLDHGDQAAAELTGRLALMCRSAVGDNNGVVLELRGDAVLAVFTSARSALRAAVSLQERCVSETLADPAHPMPVGVGLDVGEAVPLEDGYRGAALNLAARLSARAAAGEIYASQEVVHLAQAVDWARYQDAGRLSLKGISKSVPVIRVLPVDDRRLVAFQKSLRPPRSRRRNSLAAGAVLVVLLLLAATLVGLHAATANKHPISLPGDSVAVLDAAHGRVLGDVPVGNDPSGITASGGSLWVTNTADGTVFRLDSRHRFVQDRINVGRAPVGITSLGAFVWVAVTGQATVVQVSTANDQVVNTISVGNQPSAITAGYGAVWVSSFTDSTVTRIDPVTDATRTVKVGDNPDGLAAGAGALWVANRTDDTVVPIDPATLDVGSPIPVGAGPAGLAVMGGGIWVADNLDKTVTRIDAATRTRVAVTTIGNLPTAVVATQHSVWVSAAGDARLIELDGSSARPLRSLPVGSSPVGLAIAGGRMWAVEQPFESPTHFGGTLVADDEFDTPPDVDPQYAYIALNAFSIVFDGLVRMNPSGGPAGYELVPDLATTLPRPSQAGLSYTFTLRVGVHYSDGRLLKASDFRRGLTRAIVAMAAGYGYPFEYVAAIVGADACYQHPQHCDLGVAADDRTGTVSIRLIRPDPDLLAELSGPFASPVPPGTPTRDLGGHAPAGTGPYMFGTVASNDVHLVRNPRFHPWSTAAQPRGYPDQIVLRAYPTRDAAVNAFKRGGVDLIHLAPFGATDSEVAALTRQYPGQTRTTSIPVLHYVLLNHRRPPFDDPVARHAFAIAIDRTTIERILGSGQPYCGFVPPDYPGYSPGCPYPLHGDLARARALLRTARPYQGTLVVTIADTPHFRALGAYLYQVALSLGYRAVFRPLAVNKYVADPYDVSGSAWQPDFPAASNYYLPEFACGAIGAGAVNTGQVCDRRLDAEALTAQQEQVSDPAQAQQDWMQLYHELQDVLPAVPTNTDNLTVLLSSRVGNYEAHPIALDLLDQMWVK